MFNEKDIVVKRSYKTVYHVGDEIIKVFEESHPKSGVFNEALITSYVESYGVKAPAVRYVKSFDGKWAVAFDYVEGVTMAEKLKNEPEKLEENLTRFVEIQLEVNSFKAVGLRNTVDKRSEEINALEGIDASTRYELQQRLHGMKRHTKLCHGDFDPSNVIITADGDYRVIDWAHATQGNAGADAALTYLRFCLTDKDMADKYLRIYCEKSDTAIQYVQKWMPIVAAGQLTKNRPEEKELLEQWVSIAEYQ